MGMVFTPWNALDDVTGNHDQPRRARSVFWIGMWMQLPVDSYFGPVNVSGKPGAYLKVLISPPNAGSADALIGV